MTPFAQLLARRKPVILVGVHVGATSRVALRRAYALSRIFGARLVAVHVVERRTRSRFHADGLRGDLSEARRRVAQQCAIALGTQLQTFELVVRCGRIVSSIHAEAALREAVLVVVGARVERPVPPRLLRDGTRPVLVVRPPRSADAIVAATDLADDTYPVLRRAATLGTRLEVPVTFVTSVTERASRIGARKAPSARGTADAIVGQARRSVLVVPISRGTEISP